MPRAWRTAARSASGMAVIRKGGSPHPLFVPLRRLPGWGGAPANPTPPAACPRRCSVHLSRPGLCHPWPEAPRGSAVLDTGAAALTASPSPDSRRSWVTSAPRCATCPRLGSSPSASWRPRTSRRWTWVAFQVCAWLLAAIGGHLPAGRGPEPSTWIAGLGCAGHTGCLSGFGSSGQGRAGSPAESCLSAALPVGSGGKGPGTSPPGEAGTGRAGGGRARPDAGPSTGGRGGEMGAALPWKGLWAGPGGCNCPAS